jgi:hypothetical protein
MARLRKTASALLTHGEQKRDEEGTRARVGVVEEEGEAAPALA